MKVCVNGRNGTICNDGHWSNQDASVICSQLNFSPYGMSAYLSFSDMRQLTSATVDSAGAIALSTSYFIEGSLPVLLEEVNCVGNESNIIDCPRAENVSVSSSCGRYQDAGVVCQCMFDTN